MSFEEAMQDSTAKESCGERSPNSYIDPSEARGPVDPEARRKVRGGIKALLQNNKY